ncbi:MAG: ATP-dependent Clp protease adaptor ClpS [Pseudomonadota bacterium]
MQSTTTGTQGPKPRSVRDERFVRHIFASMRHVAPGWSGPDRGSHIHGTPGDFTAYFYTSRRFVPVRIRPDALRDESGDELDLCEVRIIDNDHNTYQEVMDITMLALGLDPEQAFAVAWEVDHRGFCVVAHAPGEEAEALASVIRTIGIEVQVNPVSARSR